MAARHGSVDFIVLSRARLISLRSAPLSLQSAGHLKVKEWNGFVWVVACAIDGNRRNQLLPFDIVPTESEEHYLFFLNTMLGSHLHDFVSYDRLLCLNDRGGAVIASIQDGLPYAHKNIALCIS
jgi:hypothetical protein